jgi:hypothetical protein
MRGGASFRPSVSSAREIDSQAQDYILGRGIGRARLSDFIAQLDEICPSEPVQL